MKIHFTCSTAELDKYKDDYLEIRRILLDNEHILTRDWLPHTAEKLLRGHTALRNIKEIYKVNIKALKEADLVIIEDTVSNFSTGHQITLALQMKKPTLVLWQGKKYRKFKQMFIHGIDSNILQVVEYKAEDLEDILMLFIRKYENIGGINRFNLVLSGVERKYLDWVQFQRGTSRTQVIKNALHSKMEKDREFENCLLKGDVPEVL